MLILIIFITTAGEYGTVRYATPLQRLLGAGVILSLLMWGVLQFNEVTGINAALIDSFKFSNGVWDANYIVPNCTRAWDPLWEIAYGLLLLVLAMVNIIPGLIAIFDVPVVVVVTWAGLLRGALDRDLEWLLNGLKFLSFSVGAVVVAGLVMRVLHITGRDGCIN